jgi:hypothetical protein
MSKLKYLIQSRLDGFRNAALHPTEGLEAGPNITMPIVAVQALDGGISSTNTRSLYTPNVPHLLTPSLEYDLSLK